MGLILCSCPDAFRTTYRALCHAGRSNHDDHLLCALLKTNVWFMQSLRLCFLRSLLRFVLLHRSFALPEEILQWEAWLATQKASELQKAHPGSATAGVTEKMLWMLKTGQDAGEHRCQALSCNNHLLTTYQKNNLLKENVSAASSCHVMSWCCVKHLSGIHDWSSPLSECGSI